MKILVAECKQEISSFNPAPSHYSDFEVGWGASILDYHRGLNTEMAGALSVFDDVSDVELVPTYSARARTSGGTLDDTDCQRIVDECRAAVQSAIEDGVPDAVYVSLHGAMGSAAEPDPEGQILADIRALLGEEIPMVVSMDLHGILTDRILTHADAVVAYHTYPHVDFFPTGVRAARLLLRIVAGEARPATAVVPIPALVRGNELITETGLIGRMIRQAQAIEASDGGLSAGMFIGNPFTDVPDLRSNSFVVTDGDEARATQEALRMATDFWAVRGQLQQPLISVDEAVEITKKNTQGTVILTDAADATSSGASGDSNAILRALMKAGYAGRTLMPIVDAGAVAAAMEAGIGATIETTLGGSLDPGRFTPLPVQATVRLLSDGEYVNEINGGIRKSGLTAVLQVGTHTVIAMSTAVSLNDRSLFWANGQDPQQFDAVVVKSPHCEPQMFSDWAAQVLNVDAPGSTSANLPYLGHTVCARPIFPLDEDVQFEPQVRLYRRPQR